MIRGIILVQGDNASETVNNVHGILNAKHLVIGDAPGFGTVVHLTANTLEDFNNALDEFIQETNVTIVKLALQT